MKVCADELGQLPQDITALTMPVHDKYMTWLELYYTGERPIGMHLPWNTYALPVS